MQLGIILILCVVVVQKVAALSDSNGQSTQSTNNSNFHQSPTSPPETTTELNDYDDSEASVPIETTSGSNSQQNVANSSEPNEPQDFSSAKFSMGLYEAVKESQPRNFVLSPLSVRNVLAMLSLGATGDTAEEIQEALQLPADASELINRQSNLISLLKEISSVKFVTADKIYANSGLSIKTEYQKDVKKLGGEIETVDFGKSEDAAGTINEWVRSKTEGKIDKIVDSDGLDSLTSLILLNSIYFKGSWKTQFNESDTKQRPFFLNASCGVNVSMMFQENEFQLADLEEANAQVILLPYEGGRLSMMIYLPYGNDERSLKIVEKFLEDKSPFEIQSKHFDQYTFGTVLVSLPKFKIRSSLELNEPLKTLGLGKMFNQATADFSGIFNDSRNFFVSKASQETFIEVNEEGTEAAAVTGFEVAATSFSQTPEFTANRPFLFQIVDSKTKTVLFSGRVKNPLDSSNSPDSDSAEGDFQCIETFSFRSQDAGANDEGNGSCVAKQEIKDMMLDFLNLLNFTETNNVTSRASGLQVLLENYGKTNKSAEAFKVIQRMSNTLDRMEKFKNQTQKIEELEAENARLKNATKAKSASNKPACSPNDSRSNSSTKIQPTWTIAKEEQKQCVCFQPAAARMTQTFSIHNIPYFYTWNYNASAQGICMDFDQDVDLIYLTGSCVTLYRDYGCGGQKFRLEGTNRYLGWDVRRLFPSVFPKLWGYYSPKSIGPCW